MLSPDFDLLESNVQLNLLTFRQKFLARLHTAGRSAEHPDGLFGEHYHLSRKLYAQQFSGRNDGPQIPALPVLDMSRGAARYLHQQLTAAINLKIAAITDVTTWMLDAVGPTIRAALFDPLHGGHASISIIDIIDYLEANYGNLSSHDIFSLDSILNIYNAEISMPANFVKWENVYATYASHNINVAPATRLAHFSTAVNSNLILKERLSAFFMFHPLAEQHTYDALKIFMLASDRNMKAITPAAAGFTTLPAAAAVGKVSATSDMPTVLAAMQKQIKDLTASVSKLHVKAPASSFVPPDGKCRKCWGPNKSALVDREWSSCAEHNLFKAFTKPK